MQKANYRNKKYQNSSQLIITTYLHNTRDTSNIKAAFLENYFSYTLEDAF